MAQFCHQILNTFLLDHPIFHSICILIIWFFNIFSFCHQMFQQICVWSQDSTSFILHLVIKVFNTSALVIRLFKPSALVIRYLDKFPYGHQILQHIYFWSSGFSTIFAFWSSDSSKHLNLVIRYFNTSVCSYRILKIILFGHLNL